MYAALLLTSTPGFSLTEKLLAVGCSVASGIAVWAWKAYWDSRAEDRKQREQTEARLAAVERTTASAASQQEALKKLQSDIHSHDMRLTGIVQERENLIAANDMRLKHIEGRVSQVDQVLQKIQAMEIQISTQNNQIISLKEDIRELKDTSKAQFAEIINLIREGRGK